MFGMLTIDERLALSARLRSASRQFIAEKTELRRLPNDQARRLYGTDADAYAATIDDVHEAWIELLYG